MLYLLLCSVKLYLGLADRVLPLLLALPLPLLMLRCCGFLGIVVEALLRLMPARSLPATAASAAANLSEASN